MKQKLSYQLTSCGYQPDSEDTKLLESALKNLWHVGILNPSEDEILETMRGLAIFQGFQDVDSWIGKLSVVSY
jgi:hypothetical protein